MNEGIKNQCIKQENKLVRNFWTACKATEPSWQWQKKTYRFAVKQTADKGSDGQKYEMYRIGLGARIRYDFIYTNSF